MCVNCGGYIHRTMDGWRHNATLRTPCYEHMVPGHVHYAAPDLEASRAFLDPRPLRTPVREDSHAWAWGRAAARGSARAMDPEVCS